MGASYFIEPLAVSPEHRHSLQNAIEERGLGTAVNLTEDDTGLWLEVQYDHYSYGHIEAIENLLSEAARSGWIAPPIQFLAGRCDDEPFCMLLVAGFGSEHIPHEAVFEIPTSGLPPVKPGIVRVEMLAVSDGRRAIDVLQLPQDILAHIRGNQP